jgi:cytochrome c biogenesis protein CcmG/thiol:disulfide interchange protein DsbE
MNRWIKLGLLVVFAVVAMQVVLRPQAPSTASGDAAPPLVLRDLQGRHVDLGALRGQVVLVNFWATWCPPCRAEIPELAELWREQKGRCFSVLGVAEESPADDLASASRSIPYPILTDPRGEAAAAWSVMGFPSSFLVDTQGVVVKVFQGAVGKRQVQEAIAPLLPATCEGT